LEKVHKALLVVDMLRDYLEEGAPMEVPAGRQIIENVAGEVRYAREKGRPIIFVCDRHAQDDLEFEHWPVHAVAGTLGAEVIEELTPHPDDYIVEKSGYSGFFHSELESLLDELETDEVLICGVPSNVCVLYTAMDALQRGLGVIVPETCVAAMNEDDQRFALRQINEVLKVVPKD
jgi:nicotinamidase-related amidase